MANYELAFRMQTEVPGIIDLDGEPESVREMYGLDNKETESFAQRCLLPRRLVEKGVRFVQIFSGGWDSHDDLERSHKARIYSIDKPVTALIKDLKQRGLLDDTLVVWLGEFGRSPDNHYRGGGVKAGMAASQPGQPAVLFSSMRRPPDGGKDSSPRSSEAEPWVKPAT